MAYWRKFTFLCGILIGTSVFASDKSIATLLPEPQKLSSHVYAWIGPLGAPSKKNLGYRMNMAFVVGNRTVAVLDTGYTEAMGEAMISRIRKITSKPIKYAINTNSRPHRMMGNPAFRRAGATIIAHKLSAAAMDKNAASFASQIESVLELTRGSVKHPKPPDKLITRDEIIDLGGVKLIIENFGPAHTAAQLVVSIPSDNIVYAGDLLFGQRLLAIIPEGNIASWRKGYERLKQFRNATFIPGHGSPGPLSDFELATAEYLAVLYNGMRKAVDSGIDLQQAIEQLDQSKFSKLANYDALAGRNASRAYLELETAAFE